jgi:hypothetical protein
MDDNEIVLSVNYVKKKSLEVPNVAMDNKRL